MALVIRWNTSYRVLQKYNIEGPSPFYFYGNYNQITRISLLEFIRVNLEKYGDLFGYYIGTQPVIVVKDLNMLQQIMVKKFDNFMDREHVPNILDGRNYENARSVFFAQGKEWTRQRRILSKGFNTLKLNKMCTFIEQSCNSLLNILSEQAEMQRSFDIWRLYGQYTLEVILLTGFSHNANIIDGKGSKLVKAISSFLGQTRSSRMFVTTLLSNFPFLEAILAKIAVRMKIAKDFFYVERLCEEIIRNRLHYTENTEQHHDLLKLLIDAFVTDSTFNNESNQPHCKTRLTEMEILRNMITFIIAGYETSSSALGFTSYNLALHPNHQEKLFQEISTFFKTKPEATLYEAAQSLVYLDMVIQESLRLYPPIPVIARQTLKDTNIDGQIFPEGSHVFIPIMAIHHSPDIWPNPLVFKPERFSKEEGKRRHPLAHIPFGWGPRTCIAKKLGLIEIKMALIAILKEYRFTKSADTEVPLKTSHGASLGAANGIYITIEKRN